MDFSVTSRAHQRFAARQAKQLKPLQAEDQASIGLLPNSKKRLRSQVKRINVSGIASSEAQLGAFVERGSVCESGPQRAWHCRGLMARH